MSLQPLTPERRRQQTREHLLAAAAEVFAQRGFHGASLDEVAAVAGFTKGAVYSNFKNKEDLFLALFRANYEREMQALRTALEDSEVPPEARLSDFVGLIRDQTRLDGNFGLLYQEFWIYAARNPAAREELTRIDDEAVRALAEIIEAERREKAFRPWSRPSRRHGSCRSSFAASGNYASSNLTWPMTSSSKPPLPSWRAGWALPSIDCG